MSQFNTVLIDSTSNAYAVSKWNEICRACLCKDDDLQPLFTLREPSSSHLLAELMISCTSLQMSISDSFPKHICTECLQQLSNSYYFKQKCETSFVVLQQIYDQSKTEDVFTENGIKSLDIKSEFEMFADPLQETNIIFGVEAILDETVFKQNELNRSSTTVTIKSSQFKDGVESKPLNLTRKIKSRIIGHKIQLRSKKLLVENVSLKAACTYNNVEVKNSDVNVDKRTPKKRKVSIKKHVCIDCGKRFDCQKRLESHQQSTTHIRNQPGKTIKTCMRCKIYFENPAEYNDHVKSHDIYLCPDCGHVCRSRSGYQAHLASHSSLQPHECKQCGKKYKSQSSLLVHQRNHTGERRYSCDHCENKFITWNSMKNHIRTHHTKERNHICHICSKAFSQSCGLNIHMRQHTGVKPYTCSECDMSFRSSDNRKRHMLTHTGEKNFPCGICSKRFARRYNLRQHMVTHTGERNHACTICGRSFTQAHVLRSHLRTHPEHMMQQHNSQSVIENDQFLTNINNI